jgi:hypothetical protein
LTFMSNASFEELLAEVRRRSSSTGSDPVGPLACAVVLGTELTEQAESLMAHFVDVARGDGASWSDIGDLFGITKQGAQQRFSPSSKGWYTATPGRLTAGARRALVQAHGEARTHRHPYLGPEHILLALVTEVDDDATCGPVVRRLGITPRRLRRVVEDVMVPASGLVEAPSGRDLRGRQPLTAGAHRAIRLAGQEARALGVGHVAPEHLLIGVASIRTGVGALALDHLDIDHDLVRQAVIDVTGGALG